MLVVLTSSRSSCASVIPGEGVGRGARSLVDLAGSLACPGSWGSGPLVDQAEPYATGRGGSNFPSPTCRFVGSRRVRSSQFCRRVVRRAALLRPHRRPWSFGEAHLPHDPPHLAACRRSALMTSRAPRDAVRSEALVCPWVRFYGTCLNKPLGPTADMGLFAVVASHFGSHKILWHVPSSSWLNLAVSNQVFGTARKMHAPSCAHLGSCDLDHGAHLLALRFKVRLPF